MKLLPVERVEVVVLEPHDQHGVVLRPEGGGVTAKLHTPAHNSVGSDDFFCSWKFLFSTKMFSVYLCRDFRRIVRDSK